MLLSPDDEKMSVLHRISEKINRTDVIGGLMGSPLGILEPEIAVTPSTSIPVSKPTRALVQRFVKSKRFKSYDEMLRWIVSFVGDVPVGIIHSNISLGYDNGRIQVDLQVNKHGDNEN